jgi:hypothetical protein
MAKPNSMIGTGHNQVPTNGMLGTAAYMDSYSLGMEMYASYSTNDWLNDKPSLTSMIRSGAYISTNSGGDNFHIPIDPAYKQSVVHCTRMIKDVASQHTEYVSLHYASGSQATGVQESALYFFRRDGGIGFMANSGAGTWVRIGNAIDDGQLMHTTINVFQGEANEFNRPGIQLVNTYVYSAIGVNSVHGSVSMATSGAQIGAIQFNVDVASGGGVPTYELVDYKVFGVR